ncbi:MAG: hypothetical protein Q8R81_11435 [Novosphingobium sp.]|uniref:hypothetical protein n=1 Tax=Novosphingobium sp. TaxID=1874826 RepID=UPI0027372013|nr:hypothetical protein [Novosphingobium sp.]MDP3550995.1 hypothetical protein [Novosphingobium sp.]
MQHTSFGVFGRQFRCFQPTLPDENELGRMPAKVNHNRRYTMRSFTAIALPIIFAAGLSGMMFTATLV